jgi:two-component system chemotaxis response regulator CheY
MAEIDYELKRILVIEDELHIRKIICRLLRQIGYRLIDEAADGAEGFKTLLRVQPDVILCDIHMEPVDGITFLRKLRGLSQPKYAAQPVIFLTGDTDSTTVIAAKDLQVDGYLVKPVSLKSLKDRIDAILTR